MATEYEETNPEIGNQLEVLWQMIENGDLTRVSYDVYLEFIEDYIMRCAVPVSNDFNIVMMGKRIAAGYNEMIHKNEGYDTFSMSMGIESSYEKVYADVPLCYAWIEDIDGEIFYYMSEKAYPSWFNENVVQFKKEQGE